MTSAPTDPLWKEVLGDTEPWRRGRLFLVLVGCVSILSQGLVVVSGIIAGFIEFAVVQAIVALVFWLQSNFIWIGWQIHAIHWQADYSILPQTR
jgi:hypothetical protein